MFRTLWHSNFKPWLPMFVYFCKKGLGNFLSLAKTDGRKLVLLCAHFGIWMLAVDKVTNKLFIFYTHVSACYFPPSGPCAGPTCVHKPCLASLSAATCMRSCPAGGWVGLSCLVKIKAGKRREGPVPTLPAASAAQRHITPGRAGCTTSASNPGHSTNAQEIFPFSP